jgi:hypothetical protein
MLARTGETAKRKQRLPMLTQNNQHELKVSKRAGCAARASAVFSKPFARLCPLSNVIVSGSWR